MAGIKLGYHFLSVPDKDAVIKHLDKLGGGGGHLFYQHELEFARAVSLRYPNARIVLRDYPDTFEDINRNYISVDAWIDKHEPMVAGSNLIMQTMNEPGFTPPVHSWHERLLTRLNERGSAMRTGLYALSAGTPAPENWFMGEKVLRLAESRRGKVWINLHEYCAGVITSGFHGGYPDNAGVAPGKSGGVNLIPFMSWPMDTSKITLFHVGRYRFMKQFCKSKGIACPPINITEFGLDFLGDVAPWLAMLQSDDYPRPASGGWRTMFSQWRKWYGITDAAAILMTMGGYAAEKIYIDPEIESIDWYAFGTDGGWLNYRTDPELNDDMELYAARYLPPPGTPDPKPEPPPAPPPVIDVQKALLLLQTARGFLNQAATVLGEKPPE